jgi:surface protein
LARIPSLARFRRAILCWYLLARPPLLHIPQLVRSCTLTSSLVRPLAHRHVGDVTDMTNLFYNQGSFNTDITGWDVSKVTIMEGMFYGATAFSQPISSWVVSSVTSMQFMFSVATVFNQPIGNWDVSEVTNMEFMFESATAFSQNLTTWCVVNVSNYAEFDTGSDLTTDQLPLWGTCPAYPAIRGRWSPPQPRGNEGGERDQ